MTFSSISIHVRYHKNSEERIMKRKTKIHWRFSESVNQCLLWWHHIKKSIFGWFRIFCFCLNSSWRTIQIINLKGANDFEFFHCCVQFELFLLFIWFCFSFHSTFSSLSAENFCFHVICECVSTKNLYVFILTSTIVFPCWIFLCCALIVSHIFTSFLLFLLHLYLSMYKFIILFLWFSFLFCSNFPFSFAAAHKLTLKINIIFFRSRCRCHNQCRSHKDLSLHPNERNNNEIQNEYILKTNCFIYFLFCMYFC